MKKILLTLVAFFVAVNSWGWAVNQIVKGYDPTTKQLIGGMDFAIINNTLNAKNPRYTCAVHQCTLSGDVTIPGKILVDNLEVYVVASSPTWANGVLLQQVYTGDIQTLTFEEGLQTLYPYSLRDCKARTIKLPASLNYIGGEHFGSLPNLKHIEIASGNKCFEVRTSTENSDMVVQLRDKDGTEGSFKDNLVWWLLRNRNGEGLTTLHIPEGVKGISIDAGNRKSMQENSWQGLKTIYLPSTFTGVYKDLSYYRHAFTNYPYLKAFVVDSNNPKFCSYEGIIYEKPKVSGNAWGETVYMVPEGKYDENQKGVTLPAGVKTISEVAFNRCQMAEITLPSSLTTIAVAAFSGCNKLLSITIPAATTSIGEGFLVNCNSMQKITVKAGNQNYASNEDALYTADYNTIIAYPAARPEKKDAAGKVIPYTLHANTKTIGKGAFSSSKITEINLKSAPGLEVISETAFTSASRLLHLLIPATVRTIETTALNGLTSLKTIEFENNDDPTFKLEIARYAMGYNSVQSPSISEVVYPKQLVKLEDTGNCGAKKMSFAEGSRLASTTSLESHNAKYTEEIDLSNCNNLKSLPQGFIQNCTKIHTVKLPASLETIGANAFYETSSLKNLEFAPNTQVESILQNAFQKCGAENITLPDHVVHVAQEAFAYCMNLKEVKIPATTTDIFPTAFLKCNNLVKIDVDPANTTYATTDGMLATKDKKSLLIFPPGKASLAGTMISPSFEEIGPGAFYFCETITGIVIPKKVKKIGNYAFEHCLNLNSITFLGDVPPADVDTDVAEDNKNPDYNYQDHRFGTTGVTPQQFLKNNVTINLRKNGNEEMYKAAGSYWNNAKAYTYSFSAKNGKNDSEGKNEFDYIATSLTSVSVLGSTSTNHTAIVPAKVVNPDNNKEYNVSMVGDYAFENINPAVKEIVFFGPIELIGANAFNNGHLDGYHTNPTSSIEQIIFANVDAVGHNELSTKRFDLGTEFGTEEYPEFTKNQKIYVAKSKLAGYKENMPKFASQIDYKIPGIKLGSYFGTFSREFDVDLEDEDANWDEENSRPKVAAFTGYVTTNYDELKKEYVVVMRSINCDEESETSVKGSGDGTYIPANTGVLIRAYDGKTPANFYYRIGESKAFTSPAANVMATVTENGTTIQPQDGDYTNFVMSGGKIFSLTGPTNIPVHKSYFQFKGLTTGVQNVKIVFHEDEKTTGIEEIETVMPTASEATYNLQGQRVNAGTKGLVIVNGKKMYNM